MQKFLKGIAASSLLLLTSCGTFFNQPVIQQEPRTGEFATFTKSLLDLPEAQDPVEVAVYNFSDQTGQYKAVENGSTFSTAVSQGATTILIKALEDSGWFIPIERENLSNLSTERNIIRNTKQEYIKNLNPNEPPLPPLLYAGLLLEGGIVSYDTNIITGGAGARYFGIGGSARYRQDRITVYLRAVSTNNGEILKTIYVSKTILSQAIDASFFRFVKFQRLLEAETGITQNEPVQLAVKDAIEKAVHDLILEGIIDGYWNSKGGREVDNALVTNYLEEKRIDESTELFNREIKQRDHRNSFMFSGGGNVLNGDYSEKEWDLFGRFQYKRKISNMLDVNVTASILEFHGGGETFNRTFASGDINAQLNILPNEDLVPYVYAGPGIVTRLSEPNKGDNFYKFQYGGGLEYYISPRWGMTIFGEHNIMLNDEIDELINGKRNDFFLNIGFGINYYFGGSKKTKKVNENEEKN